MYKRTYQHVEHLDDVPSFQSLGKPLRTPGKHIWYFLESDTCNYIYI